MIHGTFIPKIHRSLLHSILGAAFTSSGGEQLPTTEFLFQLTVREGPNPPLPDVHNLEKKISFQFQKSNLGRSAVQLVQLLCLSSCGFLLEAISTVLKVYDGKLIQMLSSLVLGGVDSLRRLFTHQPGTSSVWCVLRMYCVLKCKL
jgi:hypothetical protein